MILDKYFLETGYAQSLRISQTKLALLNTHCIRRALEAHTCLVFSGLYGVIVCLRACARVLDIDERE